jgi:hypothetical protein
MALLYDGPLMNTDERGYFDALTERVLGAVFEVANNLGAGFLEKVYQRALIHKLRLRGIRTAAEVSFPVTYKGHSVESTLPIFSWKTCWSSS